MVKSVITIGLVFSFACMSSCFPTKQAANSAGKNVWPVIFKAQPRWFDSLLGQKDQLNIQLIYTQIDRDRDNQPHLTDHFYNINSGRYFYPASTVKLPVAILALQKLNELNIPGLNRNTAMITGAAGFRQTPVTADLSAADARPTIAHYIKKILLVSDNDAFNRLYEFLGQEYINSTLKRMGFEDVTIVHRLSVSLSEDENRQLNPIRFADEKGNTIYSLPARESRWEVKKKSIFLGNGYMLDTTLVESPFDFSQKNEMPLQALHEILKSLMFPSSVSSQQRFNLTKDDYDFLYRYMSMRPAESASPVYPGDQYWDNYVKMIYYGAEKTPPDTDIRIFNKTGTAYGFLVETAYVADFRNNIEFLVTATIYCNSDGIFNDDRYDYDRVGYPFLKQVGRTIHQYELERHHEYKPNLDGIKFVYPGD